MVRNGMHDSEQEAFRTTDWLMNVGMDDAIMI